MRNTRINDIAILLRIITFNFGFVEQGSAVSHQAASRRAREFYGPEDNDGSVAGCEPDIGERKGREPRSILQGVA